MYLCFSRFICRQAHGTFNIKAKLPNCISSSYGTVYSRKFSSLSTEHTIRVPSQVTLNTVTTCSCDTLVPTYNTRSSAPEYRNLKALLLKKLISYQRCCSNILHQNINSCWKHIITKLLLGKSRYAGIKLHTAWRNKIHLRSYSFT